MFFPLKVIHQPGHVQDATTRLLYPLLDQTSFDGANLHNMSLAHPLDSALLVNSSYNSDMSDQWKDIIDLTTITPATTTTPSSAEDVRLSASTVAVTLFLLWSMVAVRK